MKDFKKYYHIAATPEKVYTALTNPLTIELWTGETAEMSTDPDSEFSMRVGSIVGKNMEFEDMKKIEQQCHTNEYPVATDLTIYLHRTIYVISVYFRGN